MRKTSGCGGVEDRDSFFFDGGSGEGNQLFCFGPTRFEILINLNGDSAKEVGCESLAFRGRGSSQDINLALVNL